MNVISAVWWVRQHELSAVFAVSNAPSPEVMLSYAKLTPPISLWTRRKEIYYVPRGDSRNTLLYM